MLPSIVHPSYPFGDPLSIKRPASLPKRLFELSSRALFGDTILLRAGVNDFLRWKELELDTLLPVNEVDTERNDEEEAGMWQPRSMMIDDGSPRIDSQNLLSSDYHRGVQINRCDRFSAIF